MRASIEPMAKAIALRRTSTYGSSARVILPSRSWSSRLRARACSTCARHRDSHVAIVFDSISGDDGRQGRERLEQPRQRLEELDVQGPRTDRDRDRRVVAQAP